MFICLVINRINPIVTELFIRGRKLNTSLVFITQSYSAVPNNIRVNSTHCFAFKNPNKRPLLSAFNHSLDTDFQYFMNLYQKDILKQHCFLAIDTTLASDNHLCFRKNLLEKILKLIMMSITCKIEDEKLQDYIN